MKRSALVLVLVAAAVVISTASCASSTSKSWIGSNVGVCIDSAPPPIEKIADAR